MPTQSDLSGLVSGYQWGSPGQSVSLTYSFPASGSVYEYGTEKNTFSPLTAAQQTAAIAALQSWANVANISVTPSANGDIRFGFSQTSPFTSPSGGSYVVAYAYYPQGGTASGDVWINGYIKNTLFSNAVPVSKAYETLIHELGHGLGLKHPFSTSPRNSLVLPGALQSTKYTVMAYADLPFAYDPATGNFTGQYANFLPTTPMLLDVAAIQSLYGANLSYHAGNDVYVFNQGQSYYQTIWDAGGTDTIQWTGTNGVEIDLRAGEFSQLGNPITFSGGAAVPAQLDTVAIAYNVIIENAIGGSGNDMLIGNDADNDLEGGTGNDILYGGPGDDIFFLDSIGDSVVEYVDEGIDTMWVSFSYSLLALPYIENLRAFGPNGVSLQGNSSDEAFSGTPGNDNIDGSGGFDEFDLSGNSAAYSVTRTGTGVVIVTGPEGTDTLTGVERLAFADGVRLIQNGVPVASALGRLLRPNQVVAASTLFSTTDADGDAITQYRFWDGSAGGGYFTASGVTQAAQQNIDIAAANLSAVNYVGGTSAGSEMEWVQIFDGMDWSAWVSWTMSTANQVPVASADNTSVRPNQAVLTSTLFSALDADNDAITQYRFWDGGAGGGYFAINSGQQPSQQNITVSAAALSTVTYVGGGVAGSETEWVQVYDGAEWSAWVGWTMSTVNRAPVANASNTSVRPNQAVLASTLFSVTDADNDAITQYLFWDSGIGGGYFSVNGAQQPSKQNIAVNAAALSTVNYVGGNSVGSETTWVQAFDGAEWGAWQSWTMTTVNHAPVATASNNSVGANQAVLASTLFSAADADNDAITQYLFWDSGIDGGYFSVNGAQQPFRQNITVNAAALSTVNYVGGNGVGSETVWVQAFDGTDWSAWVNWTMSTVNRAPLISAAYSSVMVNTAAAASTLFNVNDPDNDAITQYRFWDSGVGGGYFAVNGVPQTAQQNMTVSAANLSAVTYVGGATAGSETEWAQAFDGKDWSVWQRLSIATVSQGAGGMVASDSSVDTAGDTPVTARVVTLGSNPVTISETVGGTDVADLYSFTLPAAGTVQLDLAGIAVNVDLQLLDFTGANVLAQSAQTLNLPEALTRSLAAGTYYANVTPVAGARTSYELTMTLAA